MQNIVLEIHGRGLDYWLKLEEQKDAGQDTFCIDGKNFKLSLEGEPAELNAIWKRMHKIDHHATSLSKILVTLLDLENIAAGDEERLKLLLGVNALAERCLQDRSKAQGCSITYRLTEQSPEVATGSVTEHLERDDFNQRLADHLLESTRKRVNREWEIALTKVEESLKLSRG